MGNGLLMLLPNKPGISMVAKSKSGLSMPSIWSMLPKQREVSNSRAKGIRATRETHISAFGKMTWRKASPTDPSASSSVVKPLRIAVSGCMPTKTTRSMPFRCPMRTSVAAACCSIKPASSSQAIVRLFEPRSGSRHRPVRKPFQVDGALMTRCCCSEVMSSFRSYQSCVKTTASADGSLGSRFSLSRSVSSKRDGRGEHQMCPPQELSGLTTAFLTEADQFVGERSSRAVIRTFPLSTLDAVAFKSLRMELTHLSGRW